MLTTNDGRHLKIFDDGIVVNKELPKWKNARKRAELRKAEKKKNGEEEVKPGTNAPFSTTLRRFPSIVS